MNDLTSNDRNASASLDYRADITGLRAIAVLGVMWYHFGLGVFNGGFAGVDVFFVISGYLMTAIILRKQAEGTFSLPQFYIRRGMRIVPALSALCLILLAAGYVWLPPTDYRNLGEHAAAAAGFWSNFVFKREEGYFATPAHDNWMLHTWSLSVEFQFYLIYPLFLLCLRGRNAQIGGVATAFGVSFISACVLSVTAPNFAFYLLPARIWEFMAGAAVYFLPRKSWERTAGPERLGLALILLSYVLFDSDSNWPSAGTLLPVLGTALVISSARVHSKITDNVFSQAIGRWSYSIYLWHWPVAVAIAYLELKGVAVAIAGVALSCALGAFSYRFIEQPARRPNAPRAALLLFAVFLPLCAGFAVDKNDGFPSRASAEVISIDIDGREKFHPAAQCKKTTPGLTHCLPAKMTKPRFALWGDSHAGAISGAVTEAAGGGGNIYSRLGCPIIFSASPRTRSKGNCAEFNRETFEEIKRLPPEVPIIIANRYSYYLHGPTERKTSKFGLIYEDNHEVSMHDDASGMFRARLTQSLCTIAETRKVYVLLPLPEMPGSVPSLLARKLMRGADTPDIKITRNEYDLRHADTQTALSAASSQCGVTLLDPAPLFCDASFCYGSRQRVPLYADDDHLNIKGNNVLSPLFSNIFLDKGAPKEERR